MKFGRLRLPIISLIVLLLSVLVASVQSTPAHAAGETYTWKNYRTITVSGGDLKNAADCKFVDNAQLTGDQEAKYVCTVMYKPDNCELTFGLYTYKTSTKQGYTWAPAGVIPVPPVISAPGSPITCSSKLNNYSDQLKYHDKWVDLQGTRPTNPNVPETPDQQTFRVIVLAPDPISKVPASDTIYIYTGDGKTKVKEVTASPFKDDSGMADWPPDQTPAALQTVFQGLEPGDYIVCDNYAAKNCTDPSKLTDGQKITKKKYDGTGSTTIGKQFETPDKKRITVHVLYNTTVPCGSTVDLSPLTVEATGPGGKVTDQQTEAGHAGNYGSGSLCNKKVTIGVDAVFEDMASGDYKFCATGAECVTATKVDGTGLEVTLTINGEQTAPPDQKVCTSGDGIAGALAWIICPATELIAKATDFFENNIIIPFLTVSPLTTANDNPIYIMWKDFRDFANVGFIILLFISIFSIALSKYGLMKVIPRLLIVAVGINLSYFIVAFVIDAFNIFGAGVAQLVMAALQQAGTTQLNTGTSAGPVRSLFTLGGAALLAILLSGGAALGWLFSFLGLAALVIVVVVIVLIIRQIGIITLVMLSPIAILMYMLPNTESYFKKWRQTLIQLLMMYPMIVLLFAAGKIFGVVLQQPDFKIAGDGVSDEVAQGVRVILQFLVYVIPLAFLPATFAASGSLMSRVYGALNHSRLRKAVQQPGQSFKDNVVKPKRQELQMRAAQRGGRIGQLAGIGYRRENRRRMREQELGRARNEYVAQQLVNSERQRAQAAGIGGEQGAARAGLSAQSVLLKMESEDLKAAMTDLNRVVMGQNGAIDAAGNRLDTDAALMAIARGQTIRSTDGSRTYDGSSQIYRDGAMNILANNGRAGQVRTLLEEYQNSGDRANETLIRNAIKQNHGSLIKKAPDLVKGERAAFTDATGESMATYHSSTIQTQLRYMQREYTRANNASLTATERAAAQANFDQATTGFNASLANIAASGHMRAEFSGATGREALSSSAIGSPGAVITDAAVRNAIQAGLNRIDPTTGKVS